MYEFKFQLDFCKGIIEYQQIGFTTKILYPLFCLLSELQNLSVVWFTTGESIRLKPPFCILLHPSFTRKKVRGSVGGTSGLRCIMGCQKDETLASPVYKPLCREMREMRDRHTENVLSISSFLESIQHLSFTEKRH